MDPYIRVQRSAMAPYRMRQWSLFRFQVEVLEAVGISRHIFLMQRGPTNPETNQFQVTFQQVCTVADLDEYPVGTPDSTKEYPFFRTDLLDLSGRGYLEGEKVWCLLKHEIENLVKAVRAANELTTIEEWSTGTAPDSDTSEAP